MFSIFGANIEGISLSKIPYKLMSYENTEKLSGGKGRPLSLKVTKNVKSDKKCRFWRKLNPE